MNARLKPLPVRAPYLGYQLVSRDDYDGWTRLNADALFANYLYDGGTLENALVEVSGFAFREWEKERGARDGYAQTLRMYS